MTYQNWISADSLIPSINSDEFDEKPQLWRSILAADRDERKTTLFWKLNVDIIVLDCFRTECGID